VRGSIEGIREPIPVKQGGQRAALQPTQRGREQMTLLEIKNLLLDASALVDIAAKELGYDEHGKRLKEIEREIFDIMYDL